jgi:predicted DNA-binding WGR domain protein
MPRRFEYADNSPSECWEVTVTGRAVTVRYGRISPDGESMPRCEYSHGQAR